MAGPPGRRPSIRDNPSNCCEGGRGCNDGSIPRDPAGGGPPYPSPCCLSLHIRPLGICSGFADRGLSVFVIEGLLVRSNFSARPAACDGDSRAPGFAKRSSLARWASHVSLGEGHPSSLIHPTGWVSSLDQRTVPAQTPLVNRNSRNTDGSLCRTVILVGPPKSGDCSADNATDRVSIQRL